MKFDTRNPFSSWGHEEEIYTTIGTDGTIAIDQESKGFINPNDLDDTSLFVADCEVTVIDQETYAKMQDGFINFRTNNDEQLPADMFKRRVVIGTDNEYNQSEDYNNTELNYYGIQAQDLKLYEETEETEGNGEGTDEENGD